MCVCTYACNQTLIPCEERHLLGKMFLFPVCVLLQFLNSGKKSNDSAQGDHPSSLDIFCFFLTCSCFSLFGELFGTEKTELSKY